MSRTVSRILWIIVGVLLIIAGIYCLCNPDVGLLSLSLYLGIVLLISGIIDIVIFAKCNQYMIGAGWFLADGILTVLLSLFLLFNQAFTLLSLPFIFSMWLLFYFSLVFFCTRANSFISFAFAITESVIFAPPSIRASSRTE